MMPRISRRLFLGASAAAALAAKTFVPQKIGVELYTVRNLMPKDDDAVLKSIAEIGYKELEGDYKTLMRIASKAKALGLTMPSCHLPTPTLQTIETEGFEKMLTDLKGIGVEYAVVPYLGMPERSPEVLKGFGEKMNRAGEKADKLGMHLAYHNHAFEFGEIEGKRIFEIMFAPTNPKLVQLEVDVFWLSVAGQDPVDFIHSHKGRVTLLHLKDKNAEQKVQYSEQVPKDAFQAVGKGSLDFKKILDACKSVDVKHYFVEQDQTPGDPLASLRDSYQYLNGLRA